MMNTTMAMNFVIPAQVGIQRIEQAPQSGTKSNFMLNKSTGFPPARE
jgi:hypothetical protein